MLILLLGSAFFSASENAFFSLSPTDKVDLDNDDSKTAHLIQELLERPKKLLATILIGNNIVNVGMAVLSTAFTEILFDFSQSPLMGLLIQVIAVTFILLLAGEVIPKVYATQSPLKVARWVARPIRAMEWAFTPLSYFMVKATTFFDKRIKHNSTLSVDELSQALELTDEESLHKDENNILKGIVNFGNTEVTQVMRPRIDVKAIEAVSAFPEMLAEVKEYGYSRIPIYQDNFDQVIGILHIKDLLPHLDSTNFDWKTLLRKPYFVPENKKIDDLMKDFQAKKIHMAVVVDEYGGTSGIVTLEDIIEEIVGEINDEFDEEDISYSKLDDYNYIFEGKTLLNDLYRVTGIEDTDEFDKARGESETLAGFLLEITGNMPHRNQEIAFNNYRFKVEAVDNRRIKRIKLTLPEKGEE